MNLRLIVHTVRHLRLRQVSYQLLYRIYKPQYRSVSAPQLGMTAALALHNCIAKKPCYDKHTGVLTFLNLSSSFNSWNDASLGMLWAYNLNYMDWLLQEDMDYETGRQWIETFIDELPENSVGKDPYPSALRGLNWIKFISIHQVIIGNTTLNRWNDSLYSQYVLLTKRTEYHLLGNHLLEDAFSLFAAAIYFADKGFYKKATHLLRNELEEQILPDGAHFEQSPMYHCILLERLLDCINISQNNVRFDNQSAFTIFLKGKAIKMLGHLESIVYKNGDVPLINDSAYGIAPMSGELFAYARRLGLEWSPRPLKDCGYRKFENENMEAIVDVGQIAATYQPGHSHADTLNYELRIKGEPFVVDTGISTYNKNERRHYERSTTAHNAVTMEGRNSDEVWSGFRVGRRARTTIVEESLNTVKARHNGFRPCSCQRTFCMDECTFVVRDVLSTNQAGVSRIHLAPTVQVLQCTAECVSTSAASIQITGADGVNISKDLVATEYNRLQKSLTIEIKFHGTMEYRINIHHK